MFNALTGSSQYVGNWPGVTVEKKTGRVKWVNNIEVIDLPGIYSLSPYTPEEVVTREYILNEKPDAVINIIDSTNIERNLYLTTQLLEMEIPIVIALNMTDVVRKNGDKISVELLEKELSVPIIEISAIREEGLKEAIQLTKEIIEKNRKNKKIY